MTEVKAMQMRLSQFVITYGPGAILEGINGPRIIPRPDIGLFRDGCGFTPEDFEITDLRMSLGLLNGARVFRLPSNSELGRRDADPVYLTKSFPEWKLCQNTREHGSNFFVLYKSNRCPICHSLERRDSEPVRFVRACADGHLDDVDWYHVVHGDAYCRNDRYFRWYKGGGSLSQILIECPTCRKRTSLGEAYGKQWPCSGRFPEKEALEETDHHHSECSRGSYIILRQASNLRIPELRTLFTVPDRCTRLHSLLENHHIINLLKYEKRKKHNIGKSNVKDILEYLVENRLISPSLIDEIMSYSEEEIIEAINEVMSPVPQQYEELLLDEFRKFIEASTIGYPPVRGKKPSSPVLFEVNLQRVRKVMGPFNNLMFRVVPVTRLRAVTVQTGYRRVIGRQQDEIIRPVATSFKMGDQEWYPGVELFGEGVFIMLDEGEGWHRWINKNAADRWYHAYDHCEADYSGKDYLFRKKNPPYDELHPVFVWWHTLAHCIIRGLSIYAGYSSASIRERVYVEIDGERARGGIVLYATQPGSEGTMGGLIALVPHFEKIMKYAIEMARTCSNDPLCIGNHFESGGCNGPACYGCVLVSETSCEHRNMWLDREVLLENLP